MSEGREIQGGIKDDIDKLTFIIDRREALIKKLGHEKAILQKELDEAKRLLTAYRDDNTKEFIDPWLQRNQ